MRKSLILTAALAAAGLLSGCMAFMGENIQYPKENVSGAAPEQVKSAILSGCLSRGWECEERSPGVIRAIHATTKFQAIVDIPYSAEGFQLNYVSSIGLGYKNGIIHNRYNRWVNNLRYDAEQQLNIMKGVRAVFVPRLSAVTEGPDGGASEAGAAQETALQDSVNQGSAAHGSVRHDTAPHGTGRPDTVRNASVTHSTVQQDRVSKDTVRHGPKEKAGFIAGIAGKVAHSSAAQDTVRHDSVPHGVAQDGVRHDTVRPGTVGHGSAAQSSVRHDSVMKDTVRLDSEEKAGL